jgi:hypothetical protein
LRLATAEKLHLDDCSTEFQAKTFNKYEVTLRPEIYLRQDIAIAAPILTKLTLA